MVSGTLEPAAGKRYLSYREAAAYLGLAPMTLRRLVEAGRLLVLKAVPRRPRFDRLDLDDFMCGRGPGREGG